MPETRAERYEIDGGARLTGTVTVTGAKNSVLKLMAAALLAQGTTVIRAVPDILDVEIMAELLRRLGCHVVVDAAAGTVVIDVPEQLAHKADYDLVRRMRASICVLGPLIARCGRADVALPGGDAIGSRGLDLHVEGLTQLGARVHSEHGYLIADAAEGLVGAPVEFDFPSVGATENIVMAAVVARGTTVIDNAAREPEIVDLCSMLVRMGAHIDGIGTSTLTIDGVESVTPVDHTAVADRVVAGTWCYGAAMTSGDVVVRGANPAHLELPLAQLERAGADIAIADDHIRVAMTNRPRAINTPTLPYPGFPTDLQPMAVALASVSEGTSVITENVFEARFMFVNEMIRLGAAIRTDGHQAVVRGQQWLSSAPVRATDIRAGAGLALAALVAQGRTVISDIHHIDRGYPGFADDLRRLGAQIDRVPDALG
ncbi:MAG TPA: UDP-N-acetylglucosamine 1-carboxyvinyltransferase [Actinobacteria bacterium]|mgnify:CR=1 FL=1|nr:UDP-N-acetylglucosamine 1-carboxyvinyltransferase [Actinomycetota bacterium]HCK79462.1 UDP-N-acetylglucosamine 1-carboxyvinyltransferase [Actinomycetota bacterium]